MMDLYVRNEKNRVISRFEVGATEGIMKPLPKMGKFGKKNRFAGG